MATHPQCRHQTGVCRVITYRSPAGHEVRLCPCCVQALRDERVWPHDHTGREHCTVSEGLHVGGCDLCVGGERQRNDVDYAALNIW